MRFFRCCFAEVDTVFSCSLRAIAMRAFQEFSQMGSVKGSSPPQASQCMGRGAARAALPGWGEQNGKTQNFPLTFSNIPLFFGDFALSGFHFVYSEYSQSSRISSACALLSTKPRISTQNWANSFVCMFVKHYNISATNHVKPSSNSLHFAGGLATLLSNLAKSGVEGGIERDK